MDHHRNDDTNDHPLQIPHNPDVFDDDYALTDDDDDFAPAVADGFRPPFAPLTSDDRALHHDRPERHIPRIRPPPQDSVEPEHAPARSSISKEAYDPAEASRTRQDGDASAPRPPIQMTFFNHRDSVRSTASYASMGTSDDPFADRPSHPYGLYAQNVLARHTSSTTSQQPQAPLTQGPTHPYTLYPQNVVDDEPSLPQIQNQMPFGISTVGPQTAYHRQIGPYGEEQDIVGPDGHTEQLPPYSRHPEEGPTKASMAAEANASSAGTPASSASSLATTAPPEPPISPVVPVVSVATVATVAPAVLPPRRPETQTDSTAPRPATASESASLLTSEETQSEKLEEARSVKRNRLRHKKVWGRIPLPCVICLGVLILILALVLGAALGSLLTRQGRKPPVLPDQSPSFDGGPQHDKPLSYLTSSTPLASKTLFGAMPIPTPSSLVPLPIGQFSLPLGVPQEADPECLTATSQFAAWSCMFSFAPPVLTISDTPSLSAALGSFALPPQRLPYGLQAPIIPPSSLQLVTDLDFTAYGPAWHFASTYDKLVILSPEEFMAGAGLRRRDQPRWHRYQVQTGDTPWVCHWNQTYIEGYIYAQANATIANAGPNPNLDLNTATTSITSPSTPVNAGPTQSSKASENFQVISIPRLPPYTRVVKLEERRIPGAPQPYCQKNQLLENGLLVPLLDANGEPIIVMLSELGPSLDEFAYPTSTTSSPSGTALVRSRRAPARRNDPINACHCQWMSS